ncbi:hypothetical protein SESBI_39735 [Sesbania bispinosa]|nr:hypothetical protein SESBI_39735 [Sesbania bispinosa]
MKSKFGMTSVEPTFEEKNLVAVSACGSRSGRTHALLLAMSFTLVVHHRGAFVNDPFLRYKGGDITAFYNMDIDNWSYFEALSIVKELGYVGGVKLWWRVGKCEGKFEFKSITWDSHALEMVNYAIAHKTEVNLMVEHVFVAVPNVIEALPGPELVKETQVQKGGNCDGVEVNEGVNRKDKGKAVEVGDGSLEDSGNEDSETEYVGNEKTEEVDGTSHTDGVPNTKATPHNGGGTSQTDGVPHTKATPHNAGGTSQAEGIPHIEATPHNEGPSQTDATPQRSRVKRKLTKIGDNNVVAAVDDHQACQIPTQNLQIKSTQSGAHGTNARQGASPQIDSNKDMDAAN